MQTNLLGTFMEEEFSESSDASPISDSNIELAIMDFEDHALEACRLDKEVVVSNATCTRTEVQKHEDFDIHKWQWQFIGSLSEDDFCCLCKKILKEPMLTECCGAQACKTCIEPKISFKQLLQCPNCKQSSVICISNKARWRDILKLKVSCLLQSKGCKWTGSIQEGHKHLICDCMNMDIECSKGCGQLIERNKITVHLEQFCPKRQVSCEYCKERGKAETITGDHLLECPDYPIVCDQGCGKQFRQAQFQGHVAECVEMIVPCDFQFAGCDVHLRRELMPQHLMEEIQIHSCLQSTYVCSKLAEDHLIQKCKEDNEMMLEEAMELSKTIAIEVVESNKHRIASACMQQLKQRTLVINQRMIDNRDKVAKAHEFIKKAEKKLLPNTLWEVDPKCIQLQSKIISGQFTEVWKGQKYGEQVAIKKCITGSVTPSKFLQEAFVMRDLEHDNILKLLGVCTKEEPILIITEYMPKDNLSHFLKYQAETIILSQQVSIIQQVASGMAYLESKNCVHRAVSCRSVLIGDNVLCKIGSFSLAKMLKQSEQEYNIPQGERVPIKWSAPEVLTHNKCSIKSDMWSFGVVQYEVLSLKVLKMPNSMATFFILTESRIEQPPPGCPEPLYRLVVQSLGKNPDTRPSFASYVTKLQAMKL